MLAQSGLVGFGGLRVVFTETALEQTTVRLFPESKHRSKRVHKKLVKRYGGEFKRVPCFFQVGNILYAHPIYKATLEAATRKVGRDGQSSEQIKPAPKPVSQAWASLSDSPFVRRSVFPWSP